MNRSEFEELELQIYSTYHYWRKKCAAEKDSLKQKLAPISFKQPTFKQS